MTSKLDTHPHSTGDKARTRAYLKDFLPSVAAYVVVLTASLVFGHLDGTSPSRFVWAVLPVLPALLMVRAVLRHFRRIDDYQRLLLLQGLGVGFAMTMVAALTLGFLGLAGLPMSGAGWVVYSVGMLSWAITSACTAKK